MASYRATDNRVKCCGLRCCCLQSNSTSIIVLSNVAKENFIYIKIKCMHIAHVLTHEDKIKLHV